jgi:site-specific recombinase XerD
MTNPRVVVNGLIDEAATKELRNRDPLSNEEIDLMITEAGKIEQDYFRFRVKALIGLVKKFGKRMSEIAVLKREDLKVENGKLLVTFVLRKKHKKGFFQYLSARANRNHCNRRNLNSVKKTVIQKRTNQSFPLFLSGLR